MAQLVGYLKAGSNNIPVYRDNQGCYIQDDWGTYDVPCNNIYPLSGAGTVPPFITSGASSPGSGGYIQPNQSWFNDLLNWSLGLAAVGGGQTIQGGAINPQQPYIPPTVYQPPVDNTTRAPRDLGVGSSLEQFITKNSTWLLIGGAVFLLYKSGRK